MTIEIKDIGKQYGEKVAVSNFSLNIEDGETYAIVGESGCGKTTILRILTGMEQPDTGSVTLLGDYKYAYINTGMVFQENRLCEQISAVRNVSMVNKKLTDAVAREELLNILPEDALSKPAGELSGGMKRRVEIVRACVVPSDLIVMDEPFTGLDKETKKQVIAYVKRKQGNKPLVFTTHDPEEIEWMHARKVTCT